MRQIADVKEGDAIRIYVSDGMIEAQVKGMTEENPISRIKEADMENQEQNTPGLEKLFARLEEVTADMEKSDITLEESFALYNEGMQLLKQCNETIDAVEKKVQVLDENGEVHEF